MVKWTPKGGPREYMIGLHEATSATKHPSERRAHARHKITALSYIHVGQGNGGFVLDLSEGGLCFQPIAEFPRSDATSPLRFQLPHSSDWIESSGKAIWISEANTVAGLQFVQLSEAARSGIRRWMEAQDGTLGAPAVPSPSESGTSEIPELGWLSRATFTAQEEGASAATGATAAPLNAAAATSAGDSASPLPATAVPETRIAQDPHPRQVVVQLRPRWMLPVLVSSLVIVSFAFGVAVGHGSFDRLLGTTQGPIQGSTPAPVVSAPATLPGAGSVNGAAASPPAANHGVKTAPAAPSTPKAATRENGPSHAPTLAKGTSSGSHRQTLSSVSSDDDTTTFSEPSHPVSATATIAINSQRSVSLPNKLVTTFDDSDPGFHFGALADHTDPSYPPPAIDQGVEGTVELHVLIARDGSVKDVQPVSGAYVLQAPTIAAVRIWRYKPTYVNGHSVETNDTLLVTFRLPH